MGGAQVLLTCVLVVSMALLGSSSNSSSSNSSSSNSSQPASLAGQDSQVALKLPDTPAGHCQHSRGEWCGMYYTQAPLPPREAPRGDKDCPAACSGVGNCDYDTGTCYCPAGYGGPDCSAPRKRVCHNMGPDKRDKGWRDLDMWGHSRCAGVCDDDLGMCYCPPETKYGRDLVPEGAPPGTKPNRTGRPLYWCQPKTDAENNTIKWGAVSYEDLLGPNGWCNAELPKFHCPCRLDGMVGYACQITVEHYCINQCSGHGACNLGFCKCHPGWYGNDCSRKRKGLPLEPGDEEGPKPWLKQALTPIRSLQPEANTTPRKRPLIYVYEMHPEFNSDIIQYRIDRHRCTYFVWEHGNRSKFLDYWGYSVEPVLMELFATTGHRTYDPEEADYFFVPTMAGCLFDVYGTNAIPRWPKGYHGSRPFGMAGLLRGAYNWLSQTYPYFNRTKGQNHIWVLPHDEGACAVPKEIWPGIMLSQWGRMDFPHTSGTEYGPDNYTKDFTHATFPEGWLAWTSKTHPCFDPEKDLVVPLFKDPLHYKNSPYLGGKTPPERDIFVFFRGMVDRGPHDKKCVYSRCIRQTIYKLSKEHNWRERYNVWYGSRKDTPGEYGELLSRSRFCLAIPGDGYSSRFEDSILHGCIPVVIMDDVQAVFESILDIDSFSVRIAQKDIPRLVEILQAIPKEKEDSLRQGVNKVWHRYRYTGLKLIDDSLTKVVEKNRMDAGGVLPTLEGSQYATSTTDDAFSTLLQWLLWRIPYTRGEHRPHEKLYEPNITAKPK